MNRIFILLVALAVVLVGAVAPVAAQNASNNTTSSSADEQVQVSTATVELHPTVTLERMELSNGTLRLTIHAKTPQRLTLTDSGQYVKALRNSDGGLQATQIQSRSVTLNRGSNVVEFRPIRVSGVVAVTLSVGGQDTFIHSGSLETVRPPVAWGTVQSLLAGTALFAGGGTFFYVRRKMNANDDTIERIL